MKLTALMVVINEEDYVYYALKSIYDVVEEIIIVEGAAYNRFAKDAVRRSVLTTDGLSGDRTEQEITRLLDEDKDRKIRYFRHGWVSTVNDLREICFGKVGLDSDYCLVLDADTLYLAKEIQKLRDLVSKYPAIWIISEKELMFFWDLQHILTVPKEYLQFCHYTDSRLFWKYQPEIKIVAQRPCWKDGNLESGLHKLHRIQIKDLDEEKNLLSSEPLYLFEPEGVFRAFHYGWVHTPEKMEQHILRWAHATRNLVRGGGGDERMKRWCAPILEADDDEILDYYRTYHKIWTEIFDESVGEHLEEFQGQFPEVLKLHPYFGKSKEELGWLI